MRVDTVALIQGVYEARSKTSGKRDFYNSVLKAINDISSPGPVTRRECEYAELLHALAELEPGSWVELSKLWKHLGDSLASAICVAN